MDSRDYVLSGIYYSVLVRNTCQHSQKTRCWPNAGPMLAHNLWRWPNIKPALVQRQVLAGCVQPSKHKTLFLCVLCGVFWNVLKIWETNHPNHPQLRNYMTLSIMILFTLLWFLESGWLNKRWPYIVLMLDQRHRQSPSMKYKHVVTSPFIIPSKN